MQLAGGNADLGAETVNKTVGKARGYIPVYTGTVNGIQESAGSLIVFGHNTVGMV